MLLLVAVKLIFVSCKVQTYVLLFEVVHWRHYEEPCPNILLVQLRSKVEHLCLILSPGGIVLVLWYLLRLYKVAFCCIFV